METITHGLAGYMIARTGITGDTGKWGIAVGVAASLLPDADGLLQFAFGTEFYLKHHRGLTNSFVTLIPFSLALAWLSTKISGLKRFWTFFIICSVEFLVHNFLDLLTSYGTMILTPLSDRRFSLDWVFIIDLFFTACFLLPLAALFIWRRRAKTIARLSLCLAGIYVALCAFNHTRALNAAETHARERGLKVRTTASLPQPLSPFHWANYIMTEETIHEGFVNLIANRERSIDPGAGLISRVWNTYQPVQRLVYKRWERQEDSPWIRKALALEETDTYLWFARFPVAGYQRLPDGNHRVVLFDLRFGQINGRRPFVYEVIFRPNGEVSFSGLHQRGSQEY